VLGGRTSRGLLLACVLAAAGCGAGHRASQPPSTPRGAPTAADAAPRPIPRRPRAVLVTVVDGDAGTRVRGARVRIGHTTGTTSVRGLASVKIRRRASFPVYVSGPGYIPRVVRIQFRTFPRATVRVYRRATQWPMYGVTPQRTHAHLAIALRPPFRTVWSRDLESLVEFPAAVYEGVAYLANLHGMLWALSMRDGTVLWRFDMGHWEQDSSPAVVGDTLVMHSKGGRVWVLDRATGRPRWSFGAASLVESSPVVVDGVDYFGDWAGNVYALDLRTHRLRWSRSLGAKITSSIAVDGATLYLGDYAGRVWALARATGAVRWSGGVDGRVYGTPAVGGGRVFVPSSDGDSLTAFSTGGAELWSIHTGAYVYSSPAFWNGRVYFGSYNGVLYCVNAATGGIQWEVGAGGAISGAPAVVGGIVYTGSFAHRIVGADARTGRVLFTFPHGEYVPLSGNGSRFLLLGYKRVFAVERRRAR
jgi:outer membrane protein assembly factor BamB